MSSTGSAATPVHVPVLLERVTELLAPACSADGAVLVDATLGLAGHALAMLDAHPGLRLIGLDRDPDARAEAARRIEAAGHTRSEEHTSELQSHVNLVCRLLLEKKNTG